ncbi:Lrp/AsnC family transcriptional regulator [Vogesella sp. LYT5W]|uniref:Lrp/AsnC family transcriptional regulator n=1 Tax=Vogesella margarita TaxID=2984199 RepID=A0ABT5IL01_9NEIS|nr:Lrp/AsnC family transcriptional regulator [Vogesella margarita]MDC7713235.1 Lrp/AsnC family transcriptional regulator [Vogesella margarita]
MDKFDRKIVAALHDNARLSYAELARRVSLSAPAVAERVEKLERSGVISGYRAIINPEKLGYPIQCLIELTVKNLEYYGVLETLKTMPEITECYSITGSSGLMIKVAVDNMSTLQQVIARLMQYGDTKTSIVIDVPVGSRMPGWRDDE